MVLNSYLFFFILFLLFIKASLIIYFANNYKKLKINEIDRLAFLDKELNLEKITAFNLKKSSQEINLLSKKTDIKIQEIKVKVLDINFCLSEIL